MQRLKAAVIGLGVGEQHINGFRRSNGVDVVALCDQDPGKRAVMRERYPECRFSEHPDEILDDPEIDIVAIASYDHHHATQIVRAFEHGKHVFSEKPLCISESELAEIRSAQHHNPGLRLSTNTILRMSPRFRDLRDRIRKGELGTPYFFEGDYNYGRLAKLKDGWRGQIHDYSVMLGGGIHMVDLVLWLSGRRVTRVFASGNKVCSAGYHFTTPDMVVAILEFDDGTLAKVAANFGCVYPHFHKFSVYGTEASFENSIDGGLFFRSRESNARPEIISTAYPGVGKGDLIPSFIDEIRGCGSSEVQESEIFATMETCLAIDRSWREKRPVTLAP